MRLGRQNDFMAKRIAGCFPLSYFWESPLSFWEVPLSSLGQDEGSVTDGANWAAQGSSCVKERIVKEIGKRC